MLGCGVAIWAVTYKLMCMCISSYMYAITYDQGLVDSA